MALELRHWVGGAAALCGLVAVSQLPPPVQEPDLPLWVDAFVGPDVQSTERFHAERLHEAINGTGRALVARAARDDALRRAAAAPVRAVGPTIVTDLPLSAAGLRTVTALVDRAWADVQPAAPGMRVVVALSGAKMRKPIPDPDSIFDIGQSWAVPPSATDGRTCLLLVPTTNRPWSMNTLGAQLRVYGLGTCAYYAAFGRPGPRIERWLRSTGFSAARAGDWVTPAAEPSLAGGRASSHIASVLPFVFELEAVYELDPLMVACAGGDRGSCRPDVVVSSRVVRLTNGSDFVWQPSFGPGGLTSTFFPDMIRAYGRERFARFWTSPLEPDSAFAVAMGEPFDAWIQRWLVDHVGPVATTPRPRPHTTLFSLLAVALAIAGSIVLADRRTVQ